MGGEYEKNVVKGVGEEKNVVKEGSECCDDEVKMVGGCERKGGRGGSGGGSGVVNDEGGGVKEKVKKGSLMDKMMKLVGVLKK